MAMLLNVSKLAQVVMTKGPLLMPAAMSSHGSVARLVLPPHGNNGDAVVVAMTITHVTKHPAAVRLHGLGIVADALMTEIAAVVTTMVAIMTTATAPRHHHHLAVLLLGNQLPHPQLLAQATEGMVATQRQDTAPVTLLSKRWVLLLGLAL